MYEPQRSWDLFRVGEITAVLSRSCGGNDADHPVPRHEQRFAEENAGLLTSAATGFGASIARRILLVLFALSFQVIAITCHADSLPIRALHVGVPAKRDLTNALLFIRDELPKQEVNTLVLEFDFNFNFQSRPEFHDDAALGKDEADQIVEACRHAHIQLIPQINCLGHQSWAKRNGRFLDKHPEFDETPGKYPDNEGIYCRSYCPLHPQVHKVLFDLIDELADACKATAIHVGLD